MPTGTTLRTENVGLSLARGHVTHVAMITDESGIQPLLPQILLGNERRFTLQLLDAVKADIPQNIHVCRQKSAWNNHGTMCKVLRTLAASLGTLLQERYVVLVLDVASVHIHQTVYDEARRLGIRLIFIPAGLTWLLQPLDTRCFSKFKHALRQAWREARAQNPEGSVSSEEWLRILFKVIRAVLQGTSWRRVFREVGLSADEQRFAPAILKECGLDAMPATPSGLPSAAEAACIFPRKRQLDVDAYVQWPGPASGPPSTTSSSSRCVRRVLPASFFDHGGAPTLASRRADLPWALRPL